MKTFIKKPKLVFIFLFIVLLSSFAISPLKDRLLSFLMLEMISGIDNLMTPEESFLLGEKATISGSYSAQLPDTIDKIKSEKLQEWISLSQTQALIIQKDKDVIFEYNAPGSKSGQAINGLSMSKTITALLIGIALEEKLIASIDDSVTSYLPEIILLENDSVTLRDMLKQVSGMHDPFFPLLRSLKGNELTNEMSELKFLKDKKFQYSNINYYLLALILERAYGRQLSEIISEKLWRPMNLEHAKVIDSTGYCCIYATALSWLAIGELLANDGIYKNMQIVPDHWVKQMKEDVTKPERFVVQLSSKGINNFYGYHMFSGLESHPNTYWTEGMGLQVIFIDPKKNLIIVRLGDIPSAMNGSNNRWDKNLFSGLLEVTDSL